VTPDEDAAPSAAPAARPGAGRAPRLTRVLAYGLGALLLAGVVLLAAAGVPAATAVVVTAAAVIAMIALGSILGGRRTPERPPVPLYGPDGRRADLGAGPDEAPGPGGGRPGPSTGEPGPDDTMEG